MQSAATMPSNLEHQKFNMADKETAALEHTISGKLHKHKRLFSNGQLNGAPDTASCDADTPHAHGAKQSGCLMQSVDTQSFMLHLGQRV